MNANELRIGNIIGMGRDGYEEGHGPYTVTDIDETHFGMVYDNGFRAKEQLRFAQGIPLTQEWFFKFSNNKFFIRLSKEKELDLYWVNNSVVIMRGEDDLLHDPQVKYVHELQNIYFALTGKELTIIPPNKK